MSQTDDSNRPRVTGLGGIFFKTSDPATARAWYKENLGIESSEYGAVFEWTDKDDPKVTGQTVWNPFKDTTKYFEPSTQPFMINYRVHDLEGLVENLKAAGVQVVDEIASYDYGKFVHIMDPDGNKLELWEPAGQVAP